MILTNINALHPDFRFFWACQRAPDESNRYAVNICPIYLNNERL